MPLVVGQARAIPVSGLAGRIFDNWCAGTGSTAEELKKAGVGVLCEVIARAVVDEIHANANVVVAGNVDLNMVIR